MKLISDALSSPLPDPPYLAKSHTARSASNMAKLDPAELRASRRSLPEAQPPASTHRGEVATNVVDLMQFLSRNSAPESPLTAEAVSIPPSFPIGSHGTEYAAVPCGRDGLLEEIDQFLNGRVTEPEPHRFLGTVLIVGIPFAAPLAVHLGHEQWQMYSSSFATVVRRQIERFGGQLRAGTIDGIVAVFESPARAVRCALSIDSAARHFGFPVRSGLHAGELERSDHGLSGVAMQVAQRVFELGRSGEILVSSTVRDLVAGSPLEFQPVAKRMQTPADQRWGLFRVVNDSVPAFNQPVAQARLAAPEETGVLSRREREVATLVAGGKSNRRIAEELFIAPSTVERHVANILNKLDYHSRAQIAAWAVASGLAMASGLSGG